MHAGQNAPDSTLPEDTNPVACTPTDGIPCPPSGAPWARHSHVNAAEGSDWDGGGDAHSGEQLQPVSYTHLTLPTILLV